MNLPACDFLLFGMGARRKLLYRSGRLCDAVSGKILHEWAVARETITPDRYAVQLETRQGKQVSILEDQEALWLEESRQRRALSTAPVKLPDFAGHPHAKELRVLLADVLLNITPSGPLPCFFVYQKPWYRDAAMMAMVLEKSGNLDLIREWVLALRECYDRNNAGNEEPDNLGQLLYLISLFADAKHPLAGAVLKEARKRRTGRHLGGLTDGSEHPVYQTKWLKFGLACLGLDDDWDIPEVSDPYSQLFWWRYRQQHVPCEPFGGRARRYYPYLGWAADHFHGAPPGTPSSGRSYPLTWEAHAGEADYGGMEVVSREYAQRRISVPHTWHAAEMFLYLTAQDPLRDGSEK